MTTTAVVCEENSLRVIQNEYIVEHLFSFLSLNDIKNCRLANRIWRNIGRKILRKRTHVYFEFSKGLGITDKIPDPNEGANFLEQSNRMKEVRNYCKENSPENTPISSFSFQGGVIGYFQLMKFLGDVCSYMSELKFVSGIWHEKNEEITISPKIPAHLTKLHIELCAERSNVTISLCFDQISFVKDITLDNCTIVLDRNEKRLSPNALTLGWRNKYIKNETEVLFLVNEIFDLTLTKEINLDGDCLIIDFFDYANDEVERRTVSLADITVRNWEMCNWKIKDFSLDGINFLEKNFIEMEELTTYNLEIDLSKIYNPESLLSLYCGENTFVTEVPFFLPNLVNVTLCYDHAIAKLPCFSNNKNISKMALHGDPIFGYCAESVNIDDFPKGINKIGLTALELHGDGVYQLQILTMQHLFDTRHYAEYATKFLSDTIQVWDPRINTNEELGSIIQLINLRDSYSRLVIGGRQWDRTLFHYSGISNYTFDREWNYVFEGNREIGLTNQEIDID